MFKKQAYIQSLNVGKTKPEVTDEITVLEKVGDNDFSCTQTNSIFYKF